MVSSLSQYILLSLCSTIGTKDWPSNLWWQKKTLLAPPQLLVKKWWLIITWKENRVNLNSQGNPIFMCVGSLFWISIWLIKADFRCISLSKVVPWDFSDQVICMKRFSLWWFECEEINGCHLNDQEEKEQQQKVGKTKLIEQSCLRFFIFFYFLWNWRQNELTSFIFIYYFLTFLKLSNTKNCSQAWLSCESGLHYRFSIRSLLLKV